jgi:hypothetical protein
MRSGAIEGRLGRGKLATGRRGAGGRCGILRDLAPGAAGAPDWANAGITVRLGVASRIARSRISRALPGTVPTRPQQRGPAGQAGGTRWAWGRISR